MFDSSKLKDFAPGEGFRSGAFRETFDDGDRMDVPVPGDVHSALMATWRIPNPFHDRNEHECAWVEDREWWGLFVVASDEHLPNLPLSGWTWHLCRRATSYVRPGFIPDGGRG